MDAFVEALITDAQNRPYFHLDDYMNRWWVAPYEDGKPVGIRVHHILRSDTDDVMHDHPWSSISIPLDGGYWEQMPLDQGQPPALDAEHFVKVWRAPGSIVSRKATDRHRIILPADQTCWSLFIMGPREQDWGFYTPDGKVYWREYLNHWHDKPAPGESVKPR